MKLSICMPTYNFGAFIGETLDSIIPQLTDDVEIVILDGGSKDNTSQVVTEYQQKCSQIRYIQQPHKGGIDRDMATSIEQAYGEYFWLFSSDDIMKPNALATVLQEIKSGLDVYLCGLTLCDKQMSIIADHKVSSAQNGDIFNLHEPDDRARYFSSAITTTAFFSFMGSLIMRRAWWDGVPFMDDFDRTCWGHVAKIMTLMKSQLRLKYLKDSLQLKRGDNDSFMDKGLVHRYAIAIDGYHRIADEIFGVSTVETSHIRRVLVNEFPPKAMFYTKINFNDSGDVHQAEELDRLVQKIYKDNNIRNSLYLLVYRYVPFWAYKSTRAVYRFFKNILRQKKGTH
jgi:abequosyltransferase